jgi:hypothetical protein
VLGLWKIGRQHFSEGMRKENVLIIYLSRWDIWHRFQNMKLIFGRCSSTLNNDSSFFTITWTVRSIRFGPFLRNRDFSMSTILFTLLCFTVIEMNISNAIIQFNYSNSRWKAPCVLLVGVTGFAHCITFLWRWKAMALCR